MQQMSVKIQDGKETVWNVCVHHWQYTFPRLFYRVKLCISLETVIYTVFSSYGDNKDLEQELYVDLTQCS
jgi:hypothetical protein